MLHPPSPFSPKQDKSEVSARSSYVQMSSSRFLKVLLQSHGASTSLGFPVTFSFHAIGVCSFPTEHKGKTAFRSPLTPDLPPTFILILSSLGAASTGGPGQGALSEVPGRGPAGGAPLLIGAWM